MASFEINKIKATDLGIKKIKINQLNLLPIAIGTAGENINAYYVFYIK